ncbi:30S ribosome-binding factor RbfA [bacterium endosymbiont of Escarpia laminata]|uniref:30S ribosome-binding factor RbfA n=1 Tax=endosymbiont of Lamellibrachia barhami TaxID=205975 RepID=UPI000F177D9C|nr:30S ribosome-binding factor RbfA [endosymbiont of Lamellibrachia barhami]RLJ15926.1 MAG: 30S ribosome-binding factor RbfA [bacterium endosymbiont of Escarpia laminata]RLJ16678.1 MAG: 30S ribosome-binding factor RbfA [bacterium endosymbiont of Escarpia laminata]
MAQDFKRTDRIGSQLQRDLADLVREELKDPGLGMVTIQEVRVVRDLSQAKVFFTVMGTDLPVSECAKRLNQAAGHLRFLLGQQSKLRTVPKLHFVFDESIERGQHLASLIDQAVADNHSDS